MNSKPRALFVVPDIPYPPTRNGLALRYYPLIKELSETLDISLICLSAGTQALDVGDLPEHVSSLEILPAVGGKLPVWRKFGGALTAVLPYGTPYRAYNYHRAQMATQICQAAPGNFDCVQWVGLLPVLDECRQRIKGGRWVIDLVESSSLRLRRNLRGEGIIGKLKLRKTRMWEADAINRVYAAVYISPVDRAEVADLVDPAVTLAVIPNGVFVEDASRDVIDVPHPSIGFLGNMSYGPNIDAVHSLYRVYERVKEQIPKLHLCLIGRDPVASIRSYAGSDVTVTGTVDRVWPHVRGVDLFVLPMRLGAGQQNKLLEVMHAGKPVVTTTIGNGGIGAIDGESIVIADRETECAEQVGRLLGDPVALERLGGAGKRFVDDNYSWDRSAKRFLDLLLG
jgi:glycosyltransferase involved in cell wall biosynthesis